MTDPAIKPPAAQSKSRAVVGAAAVAATAALACGACCVLPFALPAAVLALSGGALAWFAGLSPWITAAAVVAVLGGWVWIGLQARSTRRRPAPSTLATMGVATALLAAALAWPHLEGAVLGVLRR